MPEPTTRVEYVVRDVTGAELTKEPHKTLARARGDVWRLEHRLPEFAPYVIVQRTVTTTISERIISEAP
jgi:hypothetical protein